MSDIVTQPERDHGWSRSIFGGCGRPGWGRTLVALSIAAGILFLAAGCGQRLGSSAQPADTPFPVPPLSSEMVARGQALYQAHCAQCHGGRGEGQPDWQERKPDGTYPAPPHDTTGHTWHHADGLLYRIVRDGGQIPEVPSFKSAMPAFGDKLSPEEVQAGVTYLKTLWTLEQRSVQAEVSQRDPFP